MRVLTAFGLSDWRNIQRDSFLLYMLIIPWGMVAVAQLLVPPVRDWALEGVCVRHCGAVSTCS